MQWAEQLRVYPDALNEPGRATSSTVLTVSARALKVGYLGFSFAHEGIGPQCMTTG